MSTTARSARRLAALALATVAAVAFASAGHHADAASAKAAGKCTDKAKGARVVLRTKTAVVFDRKARSGASKGQTVAFACLYKKGANVLLGEDGFDQSVEQPALAGPYVGFGLTFCFGVEDLCSVTVKVVDLRSGKVVRKAAGFDGGPDVDESVDALKLTPGGFVGWISSGASEEDTDPPTEVHALDGAGARKLDTGAKIPAKSLQLSGSTLSWTDAGQPRTATLG